MQNPDARLTVCFTPADFDALARADLTDTTCVVFDVLRATSSMLTALAGGATFILPVATIEEALAARRADPRLLLAGERGGRRIQGAQAQGVEFDLGNSPREFTPERVRGRGLAMTTTNGTRALRACARASAVWVGALLNLEALAARLLRAPPRSLAIVCSGTFEEAALEDTLAAGALVARLWPSYEAGQVSDSAEIARQLYAAAEPDFPRAFARARNARRLLADPDLHGDVAVCLRRDSLALTPRLQPDGRVVVVE
jgi:2-phosphosulfolactate phosphatase